MSSSPHSFVAAHRFGLGEARVAVVGSDASGWLREQIGPGDPPLGDGLVSSAEALRRYYTFVREQRNARRMDRLDTSRSTEQQFGDHFKSIVDADVRSRLTTAAQTRRPFAERLVHFWSNHFTVSMAKASARGMVGAFEREAIRPHIAASFETLLAAAVKHAAMLRYLDNALSVGPHSAFIATQARRAERASDDDDAPRAPRITGLNENLARELLELHTLGARSGYTQQDVTEVARILTGWRVPGALQMRGESVTLFDSARHEPGHKVVLGESYREGREGLDSLPHDLAVHPATALHVATKLTRHFVADEPPLALVERLASTWRQSGGDLPSVYRTLIDSADSWTLRSTKLKTPEEFVVSTARVLEFGEQIASRARDAGIASMGQRLHAAPSPAGWPDKADDWLGPEAVWRRVEWATRLADRIGARVDARAIAWQSLGPLLGRNSAAQIERAADGRQALALLLLCPEFQRR